MRIFLAGTRAFGVAAGEAIMAMPGVEVVGAFAPRGDPLAAWGAHHGLWTAEKANAGDVKASAADLIVAAHCHDYLGRLTRRAAPYGAIGYHPSLLPRHRGKSAIEWTVRMREPIAGGSVYEFDSGVDTGSVVLQDWCHVHPKWTASDLWRERLFPMGVDLLVQSVAMYRDARPVLARPQNLAFATWEPAIDGVPDLRRTELLALTAGPTRE